MDKCRYEGCEEPKIRNGYGYCKAHGTNYLRCGHPGGMRVKTREYLLEAAHRRGDCPSQRTRRDLVMATVEYGAARDCRKESQEVRAEVVARAEAALFVVPDHLYELERAALRFTEHDAEASLADFERTVHELETEAARFYRRLRHPPIEVRYVPANEPCKVAA